MNAGDLIAAIQAVRIEGMLAKWNPQVQAVHRGGVLVEVVLVMHCDLPTGPRLFDAREMVRAEWDGMTGGDPRALAAQTVRGLLARAAIQIIQECVRAGT